MARLSASPFRASFNICLAFTWGQPLRGRATLRVKASLCSCSKDRCHLPQWKTKFTHDSQANGTTVLLVHINHVTDNDPTSTFLGTLYPCTYDIYGFSTLLGDTSHTAQCQHYSEKYKVAMHGTKSHLGWQELHAGPPQFLLQRNMPHEKCRCRNSSRHIPWVAQ